MPSAPGGARRRGALIGTLLALAVALLALALPSGMGAIGGGKPAAWLAATPPRDAPTSAARPRSGTPAQHTGGVATSSTAPAAPVAPVVPSTTAAAVPPRSTPAPLPPPVPTPMPTPAPAPAPTAAAGAVAPPASDAESQVLALVNQQRAAAGCPALRADGALATLARTHSADMRDRDYFSHDTPEGLSPFDRADAAGITTMRAENIAMGQATPAAVMTSWLASPGHRANILDCSLRTLGVGVAYGTGGPWWTQDFGI